MAKKAPAKEKPTQKGKPRAAKPAFLSGKKAGMKKGKGSC